MFKDNVIDIVDLIGTFCIVNGTRENSWGSQVINLIGTFCIVNDITYNTIPVELDNLIGTFCIVNPCNTGHKGWGCNI